MSGVHIEREVGELGIDLAMRDLWAVLEPLIREAEHAGNGIGVPQLACAMRAAYGHGFNDALEWVDGRLALADEAKRAPRR